jgi:dipeptide/tripeptide permease
VSGGLTTLVVVGVILGIAVGVAFAWVNARVRVNRPPSSRERVAIMVPLIVGLLVFWYLCFTLD